MKAVQFGAGNIGRGFLAQIFTQSGYDVVFIEIDQQIVSTINKRKFYLLKIVDDPLEEIIIKNIKAVDARNTDAVTNEIVDADIIATAVGANVIDKIAPLIARGIEYRSDSGNNQPVNIIICENLLESAKVLKNYVKSHIKDKYYDYLDKYVGFVESVVSRMIPVVPDELRRKDSLLIMAEKYGILPVAKKGFVGPIPEIKGIIPYENLTAYEEQKLFIHNMGHAMFAYLGYQKGYKYIWEAVADVQIKNIVREALEESGSALIKKHKFKKEELKEHIDDLLKRFSNKALGDTVFRVGRDPIRKLGYHDRLIGGALLALKYGIKPGNIVLGICSALKYDYTGDEKAVRLSQDLKNKGMGTILKEVCGLNPDEDLTQLIKMNYQEK